MATSGISTTNFHAGSQQAAQSIGQHKHGGHHHSRSLSDIDVNGSSNASAASSTGKIGSKINITA